MEKNDIKERFSTFTQKNYYSRADRDHPLELFIGLDEEARKSIELREPFSPQKVVGTSSIEITQYKKEEYNTIRFSLKDNEISGLFYIFCNDLLEQTKDLPLGTLGYKPIVERYYKWKKMFVSNRKNILTEPEIMGLIGEIQFLRKDLANIIGLEVALKCWSGQELTHKDFSYETTWYEVKSVNRNSQSVRISSLEQLDSEQEGVLVVYLLEKMSEAYKGLTLNKIVVETQNMFQNSIDKEEFLSKVALQGYEYNDYYDGFVYEESSKMKFSVKPGFPRLTHSDVPNAVKKATYDLMLSHLKIFEIKD